jgi:hypothetical protein
MWTKMQVECFAQQATGTCILRVGYSFVLQTEPETAAIWYMGTQIEAKNAVCFRIL